jgi:hypothetical protein
VPLTPAHRALAIDAGVFLAATACLLSYHASIFHETWTDENIHRYVVEQVAAGEVLHCDIHSTRPAGALALPVALVKAGLPSLLAMPVLLGWAFEGSAAGDGDERGGMAALVHDEDGSSDDDTARDDDATMDDTPDDEAIVEAPEHLMGRTIESRCVVPPTYPPSPKSLDGESCCDYSRRWERWVRDHPCRDHPDWIFGSGSCDEICSGPADDSIMEDDIVLGAPDPLMGEPVESRCVAPLAYPPSPEALDGESCCDYSRRWERWARCHPCWDHPDWIFGHGSCDEICSGPADDVITVDPAPGGSPGASHQSPGA